MSSKVKVSSHALLKACSNGDLEKVKLLVSKGAVIKQMDKWSRNGCLSVACDSDLASASLIDYLIQQGADINRLDVEGESPLYIAASLGKFDCVKILMENGARVDFKSDGLNDLLKDGGKLLEPLLQNVIAMPCYARAIKILALELMGAVYVEEYKDLERAREYWSRAVEERGRAEPSELVQPKTQHAHAAYGDSKEFHTVEDLDRITSSEHDMWLQALLIRHRILSSSNNRSCLMFSYLLIRATSCLNTDNFDRCIFLMKNAVDMQSKDIDHCWDDFPVYDKLATVLNRSQQDGVNRFSKFVDVLEVTLNLYGPFEWRCSFSNLLNAVKDYIGHFVTLQASMCEEDIENFHQNLRKFIRLNLECDYSDNYQLLHSVCKTSDLSYPLFEVVQMLLNAGASVGRVGFSRDTPLHLVAMNNHRNKQHVIRLLLQHGCHCSFYAKNWEGKWFSHYLPREMGIDMRKNLDFFKLQCLSARAVRKYAIPYENVIPTRLTEFVNLHTSVSLEEEEFGW